MEDLRKAHSVVRGRGLLQEIISYRGANFRLNNFYAPTL